MNRPTVAVTIPTYNEAERLPALLAGLAAQSEPPDEVWIADAGSDDDTLAVARHPTLPIVVHRCTRRGRGGQIAETVARIRSEAVLVLHADCLVPPTAVAAVRRVLRDRPDCPGGALGHRFDVRYLALRLVEFGDLLRARWLGRSLGDQGQFFRRERLTDAGGFPALPIMEDVALADRLRALGKPAYLNVPLITSARRFERLGVWATLRRNARCRSRFRREGAAAAEAIFREYYELQSSPA